MLLDLVPSELYVEIARESLDDLVQPEVDRLQCGKLIDRLDLFVELLELLVRINVSHVHAANRTPSGGPAPILAKGDVDALSFGGPTDRRPD
jgi:hypothetical protein